ncbi:MAG: glutamate--tRNA ligase [candidate division SR1 bacterium]|nr:glutamate--tRNA ligase [candidate division SR1 bacterium]
MTTRKELADIIFPEVTETIQDLEKKYPPRSHSVCTRFAPSPTGFLHIGGVSTGFISRKFAKQNAGTFMLRIEDTDQKREVEGSVELIVQYMKTFGIGIDEGSLGENHSDVGNYGPYKQSQRKSIYKVFAKHLLANGLAYPCWMTTEEMNATRELQTKSKVTPGIYGNYSVRRNKSSEEILEKLQSDKNFVIRFRSPGDATKRVVFDDVVKGRIETIDNFNDIVLIKSDELPTYHLAHIADDHLMRTSHVIRSEERLPSVPLHIQLFQSFGLPIPKYCHVAPLLKLDNGNKRKLSKRHDPESDIGFFFEKGYATQGIIEFLLTLIDPGFEERQKANPDKTYLDFEMKLEKMSKSGALFDFVKLQSVNNNYLSKISTDELYEQSLTRAEKYRPELAALMKSDVSYIKAALNIERHTPLKTGQAAKDPKRFTTYADVETQLRFFFDEERAKLIQNSEFRIQKEKSIISKDIAKSFVDEYIQVMNLSMSVEEWFAQLKEIGKKYGFAGNNAEFKEGGYVGKIGDLAMFLRIQLCCTAQTPDLYSVMQVMGKERVTKRLRA